TEPVLPEPIESQIPVNEPALPEPIEAQIPVTEPVLPEPIESQIPVNEPTLPEPIEAQIPVTEPVLPEPIESQIPVNEPTLPEPIEAQIPVNEPVLPEPIESQIPVNEPVLPAPIEAQVSITESSVPESSDNQTLDYDSLQPQSMNDQTPINMGAGSITSTTDMNSNPDNTTEDLSVTENIGHQESYVNTMAIRDGNSIKEQHETFYSSYATKNSEAVPNLDREIQNESIPDLRAPFFRDTDRIIHSKAYMRYADKTQVFYLIDNDHITRRGLHIQLVARTARQISRLLSINEDLVEAIAVGHDIGHPPFGHVGEDALSKICSDHRIGEFHHNVQGVLFLNKIQKLDLTLQVLDGILCHDGESHLQTLQPKRNKQWDDHNTELNKRLRGQKVDLIPMTLEGCAVRLADKISYVGRDIQDALIIGAITTEDLDQLSYECRELVGQTNNTQIESIERRIINWFLRDIERSSLGNDFVALSNRAVAILKELTEFNRKNIYNSPMVLNGQQKIQNMYHCVYDAVLDDLRNTNRHSRVYQHFLNDHITRASSYVNNTKLEEKARDFIAGMTDDYFIDTFNEVNSPIPRRVRYSLNNL
ncbi:MAG: HD domain-containing protein, partial [Chloroflexota bacterium]|nr:HD domain-containing protein [Chloroflexota bacterium]